MKVFLRAPHNYDTDAASHEAATNFDLDEEPSMTQQQFKDECDINTIVKNFGLTGQLPDNYQPPMSGDFTEVMTFEEAQNAIRAATEQFMAMPAQIRERFDNNPQKLMDFLDRNDDTAKAEALELGITQRPPERIRTAVDAIDELKATMKPPTA